MLNLSPPKGCQEMPHWDDMKCLMHLAKGRTMTNAAFALQTNVSTVSRRLERLNRSLGQSVITKHGNTWELTPYGEALAQSAIDFQISLDLLEANASKGLNGAPIARSVTLSASDVIVSKYISRFIGSFSQTHPSIELNIVCDSAAGSLAEGTVDLSILLDRPTKGRLVYRKAGAIETGIYAKAGEKPDRWIGLDRAQDNSPEMKLALSYFQNEPDMRISTLSAIKQTVLETGWAGIGAAVLYPISEGFEPIAGPHSTMTRDTWIAYHETRRHDDALRIVADWIVDIFATVRLEAEIAEKERNKAASFAAE